MRVRGAPGYSLTELLIVIALLALVAAIATPARFSADEKKLETAADEIATAMRFARSESMRLGRPHGFHQDSGARRFRVFSLDTSVSPPSPVFDVYHPVTRKLYDIQPDDHPFAAADAMEHSYTFSAACNRNDHVYFDHLGTPRCADPENVAVLKYAIVLSLDGLTRTVLLHGTTGRVMMQ